MEELNIPSINEQQITKIYEFDKKWIFKNSIIILKQIRSR